MKKLTCGVYFLATIAASAQGTISFQNNSSTLVRFDSGAAAVLGTTDIGPRGSQFQAALYYVHGEDAQGNLLPDPGDAALSPLGGSVAFSGIAAGRFNGGGRTTPDVAAGDYAWFQVRVWETAYGATYEEAVSAQPKSVNGVVRRAIAGASNRFLLPTGGPGTPTPITIEGGMESFEIGVVPTPQLRIIQFERDGTLAWTNPAVLATYEVQSTVVLGEPWITITNITSAEATNRVLAPLPSGTNAFFRIALIAWEPGPIYSENAVGRIVLKLRKGYNFVANQLQRGNNTLSDFFPPDCEFPDDTFVVTFDPALGTIGGVAPETPAFFPGAGWEPTGPALPPGTGFFIYIDPLSHLPERTVTMVGEIPPAYCLSSPRIVPGGRYNAIAYPIPLEGRLSSDLNFCAASDDFVLLWDAQKTPPGFSDDVYVFFAGIGWTKDGVTLEEPSLKVGEALMLFRIATGPTTWCCWPPPP